MKKFKIGIISDWLGLPFKESMETSARLGADGVQIYAVTGEMAPENMTDKSLAEKNKIIADNGLVVSALCGDLGGHGFQIAEDNPAKVEKSKRIVDLALAMGTNIITTHIGVVPKDPQDDTYKVMWEACSELADYAYSKDAFFAIETGPETAVVLKSFLDSIPGKGIGVNMDPANLVMVTGDDPVKAVHTLKDYIVHTHAKDGKMIKQADPGFIYNSFALGGVEGLRMEDFFVETPLGEGDVDFDKYIKALSDIGFDGFLTIERELGEDALKDIAMAVDFLRKYV